FFRAEDGIRGFHVTGVQTCALPIYAVGQALPPVELHAVEDELPALHDVGVTPGAGEFGGHVERAAADDRDRRPRRLGELRLGEEIGRASWRGRGRVCGRAR